MTPDGYQREPAPPPPVPPLSGPAGPAGPAPAASNRPRRGMVLAAVALVVVLAIAGGSTVAWLLLRDGDQHGASDPVAAVESFLEQVYRKQDAAAASARVCSEARDEAALEIKINTIRAYQDTYSGPRFTWSKPEVIEESGKLAVVSVIMTMITGDEKSAEQTLHVSVLDKEDRGWWVCDVNSVAPASGDGDGTADDPADGAGEDRAEGSGDG